MADGDSAYFKNFKQISVESPVDLIIAQIKGLISAGEIKPGMRLPPERKLAEQLGVSRGYVREAIKRLEFYGIVRTMPQSGTQVSGLGVTALDGLITNVLGLHREDFASLVETRYLLETQTARLAAVRRSEEDLQEMRSALENYEAKIQAGQQGIDEDLLFHLKIAEASKNGVLQSLMMIITPDILHNYATKDVCGEGRALATLAEHRSIMDAITAKDAQGAAQHMEEHLKDIVENLPNNA